MNGMSYPLLFKGGTFNVFIDIIDKYIVSSVRHRDFLVHFLLRLNGNLIL